MIVTTIFFTLMLLFLFMWGVSASSSQNGATNAFIGLVITLLMGSSHLLDLLGFCPYVTKKNGCLVPLLLFGECVVCAPLTFIIFGHICKVRERYVFIGAAFRCLSLVICFLSVLSNNKVAGCIGVLVSGAVYMPTHVVEMILCFKLSHWVGASQRGELLVYGVAMNVAVGSYAMLLFSSVFGFFVGDLGRILYTLFDVLWLFTLMSVVLGFQMKSETSSYEIKMVTLEKANSAQKLFLRFIFHEVRVPFHSLLLGLEHLSSQDGLHEFQPLLATLIQSAEMMHRTINDVLLLSRLEDKKLELQTAPFMLSDMVQATVRSFSPMVQSKNIDLLVQLDPELPNALHGDQHRISQILANLLSNAIKFTKPGGKVTVMMDLLDHSKCRCYFQMQVKDEGIGMTPEDQKRLFSPFSQIRPHETQEGRGSGLGLSIVKHIVELLGGELNVISTFGEGSTFQVTLNLSIDSTLIAKGDCAASVVSQDGNDAASLGEKQDEMILMPTLHTQITEKPITQFSREHSCSKVLPALETQSTVRKCNGRRAGKYLFAEPSPEAKTRATLVVDDSETNRRLTRMILEQQGYTVNEACNGVEAVEMAKKREYFVIFMDNQMPLMNGVEATRQITAISSCPIIGLTGNSLDEDVREFMNAGARQVLIKPCKRDKLLSTLEALKDSASCAPHYVPVTGHLQRHNKKMGNEAAGACA